MISQILTLLSIASSMNAMHYVWPDFYETSGELLWITIMGDGKSEASLSGAECDGRQLDSSLTVVNTTVMMDITMEWVFLHIGECSKKSTVRFTIDSNPYKFVKYQKTAASYGIFEDRAVWFADCSSSMKYSEYVLPCSELKMRDGLCQTYSYCGSSIMKRPTSKIDLTPENKTDHTYKNGDRDCIHLPVTTETVKCGKSSSKLTGLNLVADDSFPERFCVVATATNTGDDYIVEIPAKKGDYVCAEWVNKKRRHQKCQVNTGAFVSFKLPKTAKNVKSTCGTSTEMTSKRADHDISCPILFKRDVSIQICKSVPRPIIFWMSIFWLFIGLPSLWVLIFVYTKILNRIKMSNFTKSGKCPDCNTIYSNVIEEDWHKSCASKKCPYCEAFMMSTMNLRQHVVNCREKKERLDESCGLIDHKWTVCQEKCDAYKIYTDKWTRVGWLIIFMALIIISSVPVSANHIRHSHYRDTFIYGTDDLKYYSSCFLNHRHCLGIYNVTKNSFIRESMKLILDRVPIPLPDSSPSDDDPTVMTADDVEGMLTEIFESTVEIDNKLKNSVTKLDLDSALETQLSLIQRLFQNSCNHLEVKGTDLVPTASKDLKIRVHPDDYHNLRVLISNVAVAGRDSEPKTVMRDPVDSVQPRQYGAIMVSEGGSVAMAGTVESQLSGGTGRHSMASRNSTSQVFINERGSANQEEDAIRHDPIRAPKRWQSRWSQIKDRHRSKREAIKSILLADEVKSMAETERKSRDQELANVIVKNKFSGEMNRFTSPISTKGDMSIYDASKRTHVLKFNGKSAFYDSHDKWHEFDNELVCKVTCLHDPGNCECVIDKMSSQTSYKLPWGVMDPKDLKYAQTPQKYTNVYLRHTVVDGLRIKFEGVIDGSIELFEGASLAWEIASSEAMVNPTILMTIPKISQIYETKFLYFTCERELWTQIKGVCVGYCNGYCGNSVCLGSRTWAWKGCRNWGCNPMTCANFGGCCCCGLNLDCPKSSKVAALWQVKYVKTEYVVCFLMNGRLQTCKVVSDTGEYEAGNLVLKITRAVDPPSKLPEHLLTIHKQYQGEVHKMHTWMSEPEKVILDPNACKDATSCNHGYIGDLQVNNITCLTKLGSSCYSNQAVMEKSPCANQIYMNYNGITMDYVCIAGEGHRCNAGGVVTNLNFEDHLGDSKLLTDEFTIKKLKTDLNRKTLLIYPTSKKSSGIVSFSIKANEIFVAKKEVMPEVTSMKVSKCTGCYSCSLGFHCDVTITQSLEGNFLVNIETEDEGVVMSKVPIEIMKGTNSFAVWGHSYDEVKKFKLCISHGDKYKRCQAAEMNLEEPTGRFVPKFEDVASDPVYMEEGDCSGWKWFACAIGSTAGVFVSIWIWITTAWQLMILAVFVVLAIVFFPWIADFARFFLGKFKRVKKSVKVPPKKKLSEIFSSLKKMRKNKTEEDRKKHDIESYMPLMDDEMAWDDTSM